MRSTLGPTASPTARIDIEGLRPFNQMLAHYGIVRVGGFFPPRHYERAVERLAEISRIEHLPSIPFVVTGASFLGERLVRADRHVGNQLPPRSCRFKNTRAARRAATGSAFDLRNHDGQRPKRNLMSGDHPVPGEGSGAMRRQTLFHARAKRCCRAVNQATH
jgi:hypothetical protein